MKNRYSNQVILLLFFSFFAIKSVQSQNVFWSEDFSNGNPTNWANYEPNYQTIKWLWSDDRFVGLASGQPLFKSNSFQNGFYLFESHVLGPTISHDIRLETTAIDCSNQSNVILHFENQFAWFSNQSVALLGVSTDSLTWSYDTLFTNIPANTTDSPLDIVELDISNIAANQAKVYLQFRWVGNYEFAWRLDDIQLQDAFTPPAQHDISIALYSTPINYSTPLSQIIPIEFGIVVSNNGLQTANNLKLNVEIINDSTQAILFQDSTTLSSLNIGDSAQMFLSSTYTPPNKGKYRLKYKLSQDSTDQYSIDNLINSPFIVSGVVFSKDANTGFVPAKPSFNGDYEIGNIYEIKNAGYTADKAIFSCSIVNSQDMLIGRTVSFKLFEVHPNVGAFFENYVGDSNQLILVGVGAYTFVTGDDNDELFSTDIESLSGGGVKVNLKADTRYILMSSYTGSANVISAQASDALTYHANLATVIKIDTTWSFNGFGPELTAVVRMTITPPVNTRQQVSEVGNIDIYPNPATNNFTLAIDFKNQISDVNIEIYNMAGQLILSENRKNITNGKFEYHSQNWSKGVYFIQVKSDFGKITRKIVVQ